MHYLALACDYDGTLATDGQVDNATLAALERLRNSGRKLLLVTGRELDDLIATFPHLDLFERVVAENGALLYRPASREEISLGPEPPEALVALLNEQKILPLSVGRVIVATWEPNEMAVIAAIRDLGLEHQVIFNKGAVMILPPGINKASGLLAALRELGLSTHNVVAVGDAENDHSFLSICECGVAVANALPMLKEKADYVTAGARGAGVSELIDRLIASDLEDLDPGIARHDIVLGRREDDSQVFLQPYGRSILLAGTSGGGKSTFTTGLIERLAERNYQFCIVDPEGDYEECESVIVVGDAHQPPSVVRIVELLEQPDRNVAVNLLGISLIDRPAFFAEMLLQLQQLRNRTARPHWIVVDEAHHVLPTSWDPASLTLPQALTGMVLITVNPASVAAAALLPIDTIFAVGQQVDETIRAFCRTVAQEPPALEPLDLPPGEALLWNRHGSEAPERFQVEPPQAERRRHLRKYAEGQLGEDKSFYFRGPNGQLNLRAYNLMIFTQIAEGVDEETWLYHLRSGHYSRWLNEAIKDPELANQITQIEELAQLSAAESRERVIEAISKRYTGSI